MASENIAANIVGEILQKAYGFAEVGSYTVKHPDMNHAYFIILQTFSLAHLVISRFNLMKDDNRRD